MMATLNCIFSFIFMRDRYSRAQNVAYAQVVSNQQLVAQAQVVTCLSCLSAQVVSHAHS
jgi:hypothetical protein